MDDLLEGIITNKAKAQVEKKERDCPKGAVDNIVKEEYDKAISDS